MMENCSIQRMKQQKPRKVTNFLAFLSSHSTFSSAFLPRSNCLYILIRLSRYISLIMQVLVTYFTNSLNKHYNYHYIELLKVIQSHWIEFIDKLLSIIQKRLIDFNTSQHFLRASETLRKIWSATHGEGIINKQTGREEMNLEVPNLGSWDVCTRTFLSLHLRLFDLQVDYFSQVPRQCVTSGQSPGVFSEDGI